MFILKMDFRAKYKSMLAKKKKICYNYFVLYL